MTDDKTESGTHDRSVASFAKELMQLNKTSKRTEKKRIIQRILDQPVWTSKIAILSGQEFDDNGIARGTATKAISRAWNKPRDEVKSDVNDAGSVEEALINYPALPSDRVDVREGVDRLYEDVKSLSGESGDAQVQELGVLLRAYRYPWVVALAAVGDMNIGVTHKTIAAAAGDEYALTKDEIQQGRAIYTDSNEFVQALKNGWKVTEPTVGQPFKPMKAKSIDVPDDTSDWVGQIKLDGYRCTIHVREDVPDDDWGVPTGDNQHVWAFSSALNDQTRLLPELQDIDWPDGNWVFDAEVMASDGSYTSTSERMQRKPPGDDIVDPSRVLPHTMNFWIFDVIVADGESVFEDPFEDRIDTVIESAPMDERVIPVFAHEDVDRAREEALEQGYEGIILKEKDHEFEFGKRSGSWIKDKLTTETVDLAITGFEEGTGSNAGTLGAIEVATSDGNELGKVGTGFTDADRDEIWENKTEWLGAVVEVQFDADEGYEDGLRFPSFIQKREDKLEADSSTRLENIVEGEE